MCDVTVCADPVELRITFAQTGHTYDYCGRHGWRHKDPRTGNTVRRIGEYRG